MSDLGCMMSDFLNLIAYCRFAGSFFDLFVLSVAAKIAVSSYASFINLSSSELLKISASFITSNQ